jgi:hypothetical protein
MSRAPLPALGSSLEVYGGSSRYGDYTTTHRRFAGRSRIQFQVPVPSFPPLHGSLYSSPFKLLDPLGLNHFTHSWPESRTLGRVTRWLLLGLATRTHGSISHLSPALTLASPSAGTLTGIICFKTLNPRAHRREIWSLRSSTSPPTSLARAPPTFRQAAQDPCPMQTQHRRYGGVA